jgi:ABC-2 type transport system permease protein
VGSDFCISHRLGLWGPEPRARLLLAKGVALFGSLIALVWVTLSGLALGAFLIGERLAATGLLATGVTASAFALAIGSAAMLCSSFSSDRGKAAGLAAGLALASYLAWVIAGLSDRWHWLSRLSIFTAYQPQTALTSGRVPGWETLALLAVTLACTVATLALFQRRNVIA